MVGMSFAELGGCGCRRLTMRWLHGTNGVQKLAAGVEADVFVDVVHPVEAERLALGRQTAAER